MMGVFLVVDEQGNEKVVGGTPGLLIQALPEPKAKQPVKVEDSLLRLAEPQVKTSDSRPKYPQPTQAEIAAACRDVDLILDAIRRRQGRRRTLRDECDELLDGARRAARLSHLPPGSFAARLANGNEAYRQYTTDQAIGEQFVNSMKEAGKRMAEQFKPRALRTSDHQPERRAATDKGDFFTQTAAAGRRLRGE
jgi:hypothetical protein